MRLKTIMIVVSATAVTAFVSGCPKPSSTVVTPGTYCSHEGATGSTPSGTPMRCIRHPGENRPRWRTP